MEEKEKNTEETLECVKEETEKIINNILEEGIHHDNIDFLGKVVDIHKDAEQEEYHKIKEESMRYGRMYSDSGEYGNYGRGRRRDSRGRYMTSGRSDGRIYSEGRGGRYAGHDMIDDMSDHYGNYSEMKDRYGADESTMKSLHKMLQSVEEFMMMLEEEATSQEEVEMIKKTARKIADM